MQRLTYRLPWPPSANNNHSVYRGRKILSAAARAYQEATGIAVIKQAKPAKPLTGPLTIALGLWAPAKPKRRRDADNYTKPTLDALVATGVIADDNSETITALRVEWLGTSPGGHVMADIFHHFDCPNTRAAQIMRYLKSTEASPEALHGLAYLIWEAEEVGDLERFISEEITRTTNQTGRIGRGFDD